MNRFTVVVIVALLLIIVTDTGTHAAPPLPSSVYGTVRVEGEPVAESTLVTAWIEGVRYAATGTFLADGDSVFRIDVPGDDPDTPVLEGGTDGQTIVFQVRGKVGP